MIRKTEPNRACPARTILSALIRRLPHAVRVIVGLVLSLIKAWCYTPTPGRHDVKIADAIACERAQLRRRGAASIVAAWGWHPVDREA